MPGLNVVTLVGRVGKVELKYAQSGLAIAKLTVIVETVSRGDRGEKEYVADLPLTAFGATAEASANIPEGAVVVVAARLATRTWEKDGQERKSLEVVATSIEPLNAGPHELRDAGPHAAEIAPKQTLRGPAEDGHMRY